MHAYHSTSVQFEHMFLKLQGAEFIGIRYLGRYSLTPVVDYLLALELLSMYGCTE